MAPSICLLRTEGSSIPPVRKARDKKLIKRAVALVLATFVSGFHVQPILPVVKTIHAILAADDMAVLSLAVFAGIARSVATFVIHLVLVIFFARCQQYEPRA